MIPWFWALAALFGIAGLTVGFLIAPIDAQQGEGYRIISLHVPASWLSMFIYLVMAFWAGLGLAFNFRLQRWHRHWRRPARCSPSSRCGPARCGQADVGDMVGGTPDSLLS